MQDVQFRTAKSIMAVAGKYHQAVARPYQTNFDQSVVNKFDDITHGGTIYGKAGFAQLAPSVIVPQTRGTHALDIANGWGNERMSYVFHIESKDQFGMTQDLYLAGYTDHAERRSLPGGQTQLNPQMRFYINTSIVVDNLSRTDSNGRVTTAKRLRDISHVLNRASYQNITANQAASQSNGIVNPYNKPAVVRATPANVISEMLGQRTNASHANGHYDARNAHSDSDHIRGRRNDGISSNYLDNIISSVLSNRPVGNGYNDNRAEVNALRNAHTEQAPASMIIDPLINQLLVRTGYAQFGYVTWQELTTMLPDLDKRTEITKTAAPQMQQGERQIGSFEANPYHFSDWNGQNLETIKATQIAHALPALMLETFVGTTRFHFTNMNQTSQDEITPLGAQAMFGGLNSTQQMQLLQRRMLTELMPVLTNNGQHAIQGMVMCDVYQHLFVHIAVNGSPTVSFNIPTFCDAIYSPVISVDNQSIANIASDLYQLTEVSGRNSPIM